MVQSSEDVRMDKKWRPNPVQSPWAAEPKESTPAMFRLEDHASEFYNRVVPDRFLKEGDDRTMNSLISRYSLEGNNGGIPTGNFFLDKDGAKAVSREVVGTHFGFTGEKRENLLNQRFNDVWNNIDVNKDGIIPVA